MAVSQRDADGLPRPCGKWCGCARRGRRWPSVGARSHRRRTVRKSNIRSVHVPRKGR